MVSRSKIKVTVTWSIKSVSVQLLKHIKLRDTIIGVLVGLDRHMIPIGVGVSRSKVKVTVTWIIQSLYAH